MPIKKIILATISFVIIGMILGIGWHLVLFEDVYKSVGAFTREEPIITLGFLSMIIQGLVIAYLYPFYYSHIGGNPVVAGIKFTFIAGMLIYTVMGFAYAAKANIEPVSTYLIYHTGFQFIQFALTGAFLGAIFGRCEKSKPSL